MKKLIAFLCVVLIIGGAGVFCYGMYKLDWKFDALTIEQFTDMSYTPEEAVESLSVDVSDSKMTLVGGDALSVQYRESDYRAYQFEIAEGKLNITEAVQDLGIKERIGKMFFNTGGGRFVITVPADFGAVELKLSGGSVVISDLVCASVNVSGSNAAMTVNRITCPQISLLSTNGAAMVSDLKTQAAAIGTTNGAVSLSKIEAAESVVCTTTNGAVSVADVSARVLSATTTDGPVAILHCAAEDIDCTTTNGAVRIGKTDAQRVGVVTTNGPVVVELTTDGENYTVEQQAGAILGVADRTGAKDLFVRVRTKNGASSVTFGG